MKRALTVLLLAVFLCPSAPAGGREVSRPLTWGDVVAIPNPVRLAFPGQQGAVDYQKFGRFEGVGTANYRYVITDRSGLAQAVGQGVFPNQAVTRDPRYRELLAAGALEGNHWNFANIRDVEKGFYKWASTAEDPGVKQFYTSVMLERAGLLEEAIKGFYAVAVHFPKTVSYTYYDTPWHVGPAAMDRIEQILRRHPHILMEYHPGRIEMENKFDNNARTDKYVAIDPGRLVSVRRRRRAPSARRSAPGRVVETRGGPDYELRKYANGHWAFFVEGKPFPIRAITYSVTPVGKSPDRGTWNVSRDWQLLDTDGNGVHDGLFESYIDLERTNRRDPGDPVVGDATLLKEMGVNTLRAYHHLYNRDLFRRLYDEYGLYVMVGDLLGGYAVGSGALWHEGTDYRDPAQQEKMLESVREMVEGYKDEPYVLMWVLGNENIYGEANNSPAYPETFWEFTNRAARFIKELDPTRPVAISNGDMSQLHVIAEKCPDVDVYGGNFYRGEQGFGRHLFDDVRMMMDRPVLITEYGASAYYDGYTTEEAEMYQAMYLANNWEDMEAHMAGSGVGNALGGVLFEYIDEWWKANSDLPERIQKQNPEWYAERAHVYANLQPETQDKVPQFGLPLLDGWSYEEWFGIVGMGDGTDSPFLRQLRPAYHMMKRMWNQPVR